ncbi:MAG TPA: nuclease-related domain-containing protein [Woeseiaceae bacterium]|nr:nuclease-related domain-containing protein [Woeseiaceae bacterium]
MFKNSHACLFAAALTGPSAAAADDAFQTGITGVGPAILLFTIAAALLLTLIFRSTANHLARVMTAWLGRWRIRTALAKRSPDVLHDFILPGAYGGLAKIDHAVLTAGGILCIQSKHYNGVVFGTEDEAQWTNVDGVRRRRFLNPLIQNEGRTRALQKIVPNVPVANLVIFTGSVEFTTPPPKNVIHVDDLESYVAKFVFGPSKVKDWHAVWMTVTAAAMTDEGSRKDFRAQVGFS